MVKKLLPIYWLYDSHEKRYQKSARMSDAEAQERNAGLAKYERIQQRWVIPVIPDLKGRHVAALRSICETFPGVDGKRKPAMCVCGRAISSRTHFTSLELNNLSPEARLVAFLGEP